MTSTQFAAPSPDRGALRERQRHHEGPLREREHDQETCGGRTWPDRRRGGAPSEQDGPRSGADRARRAGRLCAPWRGLLGSHYDEGRITRRFDAHPFWRQANSAAISRYGEISAESGADFYREVGVLHVGPRDGADVAAVGKITAEAGIPVEAYDDAGLAKRISVSRPDGRNARLFRTARRRIYQPASPGPGADDRRGARRCQDRRRSRPSEFQRTAPA